MNSLERVLKCLSGEVADRRPFTLTLSLYGARLIDCPLKTYYTESKAYAEGQQAVRETFQADLLFSPFVLMALGEAFGSRAVYFDHQAPNLDRPSIRSIQEALKLSFPEVDLHPRLLYQREAIRLMASRFGGEVPIVGVMLTPMDLPPLIMGLEAWLEALLFEESAARAFLERSVRFCTAWGNALLADGVTVLAMPAVLTHPSVASPRIVRELGLPALQACFQDLHGPVVMHHGGLPMTGLFRDYASLPNVVGLALDQRDSFAQARQEVGSSPLLLGNLDGPTLDRWTPEALERHLRKLLEERSQDPRFLLASSGADIPLTARPELIQVIGRTLSECNPNSVNSGS